MDFPELTLATTAHNNEQMSHEMLSSFEEHVGLCAEIVVVDDGSKIPYRSPKLSSPVRLVRNEQPTGFCHAADQALRLVRTPIALLVDTDVLFLSGNFRNGYMEFAADESLAWVGFLQQDSAGNSQESYEAVLPPAWIFGLGHRAKMAWQRSNNIGLSKDLDRRIAIVDVAYSSCTLVRMAAFQSVGGFDLWYWQAESDVDLAMRIKRQGFGVGVDTGYVVMHYGIGSNSQGTARTLDFYRARLHLFEKLFPTSKLYLRPLLLMRHFAEVLFFSLSGALEPAHRETIPLRITLLTRVLAGY